MFLRHCTPIPHPLPLWGSLRAATTTASRSVDISHRESQLRARYRSVAYMADGAAAPLQSVLPLPTSTSILDTTLPSVTDDMPDVPKQAPEGAITAADLSRPVGVKRMLALHVGYVGTAFCGLQAIRSLPVDATVECVLERALLRARMISADNYGDLFKIKWSRSSRTDKGVHSLGTVVAAKLVFDSGRFGSDHEGISIAAAINEHLPPTIRVFSAQRVNGKFSARWACRDRTYEYYLPASLLNLRMDGGPEDTQTMAALRSAMALLEGRHPFHNYAGRRRTYMTQVEPRDRAVAEAPAAPAAQADQLGVDAAPGNAAVLAEQHSSDAAQPTVALSSSAGTHAAEPGGGNTAAAVSADQARQEPSDALGPSHEALTVAAAAAAGAAARADHFAHARDHRRDGRRGKYKGKKDGERRELTEVERAEAAQRRIAAVAAALRPDADGSGGTETRPAKRNKESTRQSDDGIAEDDDDREGTDDDEEDKQFYRDVAAAAAAQGAAPQGGERRWQQNCYWISEIDNKDRVGIKHYRDILSFTADDPKPLVPGGQACIRTCIHGGSFMLHQIRHMIGAAVAVARGLLTLELIEASLMAPARVAVPRVPPHTLLLAGSSFAPFRGVGDDAAIVTQWTRERLELRARGQEARRAFRDQVLDVKLNELLSHPDWAAFRLSLDWYHWPEAGRQQVLQAAAEWKAMAPQRRRISMVPAADAEPGSSCAPAGGPPSGHNGKHGEPAASTVAADL